MWIGKIFENVNFFFFQKSCFIISEFQDIIKLIIRKEFVKKIQMPFGLNNVEILVINSVHKVIKIGTVVINKLINERFSNNLLFFFLEFLLLFDQFIFLGFTVL